MGIGNRLVFDINNNVEDFIFILSTKDFRHLGALQNVIPESVSTDGNLEGANTINFEVCKTVSIDGENIDEPLWDEIDNLKLVYVRELDEYFEIEVQLDDTTEMIRKTVNATSLCESELSQIKIYGLEVNTDTDIERADYEPTIFYNPKNPKASLLHRVMSFASHYTIMHVDESLRNIQRTFSVDETPIYDWLMGECADEFNCTFQFDSSSRGIYVYDLYTVCKDCGYRGEYMDKCPKCDSENLKYFGTDTTIYIDKENLTDAIQFTTDVGSIKNCLKLVAGDELLTSVIKTINPNGSDFIIKPTESQLAEMPEELRNKIISYDELYISKKDDYEKIILDLYEARAKIDYYTHTMMPTIEHAEVTAKTEADKLTKDNLNPVGLSILNASTNKATVESVLKNYVKVFVKTGYVKVDINQSDYKFIGEDSDGYNYGTWTGNFKVTNYSNEEDIAYSDVITLKVTGNYQYYVEQKVLKNIANNSDEEDSVFDVLSIDELDDFKEALKLYCSQRLKSFADAVQSAIDVLIEEDQASESADLYNVFYTKYYDKLQACQNELNIRNTTIAEWKNRCDNISLQKEEMQAELNFTDYLGEDLYKIFCMYRREDTYRNDNYKSYGLSDSELIQKAKDFIEVAEKQLEKARTPKHSISSTLYNLLLIPEFKPLLYLFKLGNWLRIRVDGELYRLRLIGYKLNFSSIQTLEVTFSNVTKVNSDTGILNGTMNNLNSIATNFITFIEQAKKGNEANVEVTKWLENGLNSALTNIKNNNNEEIVIDKHGLWAKTYDAETGNFAPEQLRITHNILAMTDNNWLSSTLAIGKHNYTYYDGTKFVTGVGFGVSAKFLQAPYMYGGQIISAEIYSENFSPTTGSHIDLKTGAFTLGGGKLVYDPNKNSLTVRDLTIDWNTTTSPSVGDVDGLDDKLTDIESSIKNLDEEFADELTNYVTNTIFNGSVAELQAQIDGNITTWFQDGVPSLSKYPSSEWKTNDDKNKHLGDLYYDNNTGYAYRFQLTGNTYEWVKITDTDVVKALADAKNAQDTADGKRRVFVVTPIPPYDVGDLWAQGENGELMKCIKAKTANESYSSADWARASKYTDDSALHSFIDGDYADDLELINKQIDQKAETWYQTNDPSVNWTTTELKDLHVGDLWFNLNENKNYIYTSSYTWQEVDGVPDSVYDAIDGKAQIFTSQPVTPYYAGDLYVQGAKGDIYVCQKERLTGSYSANDWVLASKYTDDTELYAFINGDFATAINTIKAQADQKAETWYQETDPSLSWSTEEKKSHTGDLWYSTSDEKTYIWNGAKWEQTKTTPPSEVFDQIDGKAQIFVSQPKVPYRVGDLWFNSTTSDIMTCVKDRLTGSFTSSDWEKRNKYTDDTKANEALEAAKNAQTTADSAKGVAENAQTIGNTLVNVLGYDGTKITGTYIYSPVVSGGTIMIGDKNGTYAQITTNGILNCTGANISGNITATSLDLVGCTLSSSDINDLDGTIKSYGYQTESEAKKIVESYGYQTSDNVKSIVTSYGYQDANKVKGIVESYGYTTNSAAYKYLVDGDYFLVSGTKISELTGYTEFANSLVLKSSISSTAKTETITLPSGEKVNRIIYTTVIPNSNGTSQTFKTYDDGSYVFTNIGIGNGSSDPANSSSTDTYVMIDKNGCLTADNAVIRGNIYAINGYFNGTVHATSGSFTGDIVANSLTLGSNVSISSAKISGLSTVATSGKYSDLSGKPTIPSSVEDLGFNSSNVVYKGDISQTEKTDSNGIKYMETTVPTSSGNITYSTYKAEDYVVFGRSKGTDSAGNNYVCISADGLLTARNAFIYGTVYATDGEFSGKIVSSTGEIGGWTIGKGKIYGGDGTTLKTVVMQVPTANNTWVFAAGGSDHSSYGDCPFRVSKDGALYSSNINASGGKISGNLEISGSLTHTSGDYRVTMRGVQSTLTHGVFYITDSSSGTATYPFRVNGDGSFSATKATIKGVLTCSEGSSIGGFETDNNSIFSGGDWSSSNDETPDVFMCTGSNNSYTIGGKKTSGWCFGAGGNFGVTKDGAMYCSSGQIGGWNITNSYLEGTGNSKGWKMRMYPQGKEFNVSASSSNTFFLVVYANSTPYAGISVSGWKTIYNS